MYEIPSKPPQRKLILGMYPWMFVTLLIAGAFGLFGPELFYLLFR